MPRQSEALVSSIKQAIDLASLVGDYLPLQRAGTKYKTLCPFHDDHNPSLEINPDRQSFKCWVCGAGGDIFDFIQRYERIEFPEALRMLAERAGISLSQTTRPAADGLAAPSRSDLLAATAWAELAFAHALTHSADAQAYLDERQLDPALVNHFRLGFAPDQRDWLSQQARRDGIDVRHLELAGLITRPTDGGPARDRFRGRLIFPIHDWQGRPIAFGGRILPEIEKRWAAADFQAAKYINSPETPLFQKRRTLYAAHLARDAARQAGWVAAVEGYTDVIAAHKAGLLNVVGTLGTALGDDHVGLLHRLAPRVILVFDGDEAGQKAAERAIEFFLGHEIDARVLTLPDKLDPCDFLNNHGATSFQALLDNAADPLQFALERAASRFDLASAEGTRQASEWLLQLLARVPQTSRAGLELKLAKALDTFADRLVLPLPILQRRLRDLRRAANAPSPPLSESTPAARDDTTAKPIAVADLDPLDVDLIRLTLDQPQLLPSLRDQVALDEVLDPPLRHLLAAAYDLLDQGLDPGFQNIASRVGPAERALAASLLSGFDAQPSSGWVRSAPGEEKLDALLGGYEQRRWRRRLAAIDDERRRLDPITDSERLAQLRREGLALQHQRPRARKTSTS